jgi:hypothetical protein
MTEEMKKSKEVKAEEEIKKENELTDQELGGVAGGVGTAGLCSMEVEPVDFRPKGSLRGMEVEPVDFVPKPRL